MIIESVRVRNFRSIQDETLECEPLTVLVGANGTGKSAFLRAIELFYTTSPKVEAADFYGEDVGLEMSVAVTFSRLTDSAKTRFARYLQGERLTVERVIRWDSGRASAKYHGSSLQWPAFQTVRNAFGARDRGKSARAAYENLKTQADYTALPAWSSIPQATEALRDWEAANQGRCTRSRDDGQFFGFTEVAEGYLGTHTRLLFVPAVRDASEAAADSKGTVFTTLMDMVVRSVLSSREDVKRLRDDTKKRYAEIMAPERLTELKSLKDRLTETLKTFVPGTGIDLLWRQLEDFSLPMPKADAKLTEDGFPSAVERAGHGLQRAFLLTLLQHLVMTQAAAPVATSTPAEGGLPPQNADMPDLVLVIEEPELYQHPSRQRHLSGILLSLATGAISGVAEHTQVVYATHSPLFVGIDRVDQIRLLRKHPGEAGKPNYTKVVRTSLDKVAQKLQAAQEQAGQQFSGAALLPRLSAIMTPWMNEGFFADAVVLVEGEDDRAAIIGAAKAKRIDLESVGFAVIPCGGKNNLDRPYVIFCELGIPVFVCWDSDYGAKDSRPEDNRRLQRLLGCTACDDWPCRVERDHACFKVNLEGTLKQELGPTEFDGWLRNCQDRYGIAKREYALKNPTIIKEIIEEAGKLGKASKTLDSIVDAVLKIRPDAHGAAVELERAGAA